MEEIWDEDVDDEINNEEQSVLSWQLTNNYDFRANVETLFNGF